MKKDLLKNGIFITGTDTDAGKTYIARLLASSLVAKNYSVTPRKPVESGSQIENSKLIPSDALALLKSSNYKGSLQEVCPFPFELAISPERAAELAGTPINLQQLVSACNVEQTSTTDFLLVEGAGGIYSPICTGALNIDLAVKLALPVLLVANNKLGCINHTLLSIEAIKNKNLKIAGIILNQVSSQHSLLNDYNLDDIQSRTDIPVYSLEHQSASFPEALLKYITQS